MNHSDIRIGTMVEGAGAASYIEQILPYGFESFQIKFWQTVGDVNLKETAKQIQGVMGDKAIVSSLAMFGNPLTDANCERDFARCIKAAKLFGCDMVTGFAGALEDRPVQESMAQVRKVWGKMAKLAEDNGVRIAWENCDMGGTWERPSWNVAHAPSAWEMMFNEVPSDAVGLEWEPCHQMNSLIDPIPQLRKWAAKVYHVHGKDATIAWDVVREYGIRSGRAYVWHRTPGFGDTNWTDVISILRVNGYKGTIDIEGWHDPVYSGELEMTGQVHGLNYLKKCRGGEFVANPV